MIHCLTYIVCYRIVSPTDGQRWRITGADSRLQLTDRLLTQLAKIHVSHAGWEFLLPVLCWDPRPLVLQPLFDVLLLALLKESGVLVAVDDSGVAVISTAVWGDFGLTIQLLKDWVKLR